MGGGEPRLPLCDPGRTIEAAADRRQRQHRARARRARLGNGHLRDVPDHARHLRLALPERDVRARRRHRPSGRRRDRRVLVRDRRVLRRQMRGHDHLGSGLLAEAGGDRARRDGGDPARGDRRAARRAEHRAADEGRAGRPARSDVREPRRCAEGRDGGEQHRGLLLLGDHRAQDRGVVQHPRRSSLGRESRNGATTVPATSVQRGLARAAGRPHARRAGGPPVRLGSRDRPRDAPRPGPAGRHAHRHRARPRPRQPRCLRRRQQRGRAAPPQPEARRAAEDAEAAAGLRRPRRRAVDRRLGQHEGRDRGGGRAAARRGTACLVAAPAVPATAAAGDQGDHAALRPSADGRRQLVGSPGGRLVDDDNRRYSPLATILRSRYLVDVDCWSEARGEPIKPATVCNVVRRRLERREAA